MALVRGAGPGPRMMADAVGPAGLAALPGHADRMRRLDLHPRRALPGSPRVLRHEEREGEALVPAQILLLAHLRILLFPLCHRGRLALTGFHLLLPDWRGLLIAGFALVWMANVYMGIFGRIRLGIKHERVDIEMKEKVLDKS